MKAPLNHAERYAASGYVLADTAHALGGAVTQAVREKWGDIMFRMASADDLSETADNPFDSGRSLADYLDIAPTPAVIRQASGLLAASQGSPTATTLDQHFAYRKREAETALGLLQYSSPKRLIDNQPVWQELYGVSVVSIYLDSFLDARDDINKLPQFQPKDVQRVAAGRILSSVSEVKPSTWMVLGAAMRRHKLVGHLGKDMLKSTTIFDRFRKY